MSSMLEQAIVDATALKEAAMKNAEAAILEKYSGEIKETVENILSEDEEEVEYAAMQAPPEELEQPQDDDNGVFTLNLDQLEDYVSSIMDDEVSPDDMVSHDELADNISASASAASQEIETGNLDEEVDLENLFEGEEEIEITQEQIKDIVEKLTLDFHPEKTGWLEKPRYETRQAELEAEALAAHDDSDDEQMDKLKEALEASETENENLRGKLQEMTNSIQEMQSFANKVKRTLSEVNLQNARLLYTNKALSSDSLNGRQKTKLAEAISNSKTVEEAKVIYETLQGAVGEQRQSSSAPKSLSEAVTKRSSALLKGSEAKQEADPNLDRMKRLAGIN